VYYPPYAKRNDIDWGASPWNTLAWRGSPWVAGKDPYDPTVQLTQQNNITVRSTPTHRSAPVKPSSNYLTAPASEARINHEILMRCTSENLRPGQTYMMRPRNNSAWLDELHNLPRRIVYGSMLGGTAVVSGVLVKILLISDPKQILTYITEGKFDGKYWKNMLDTRDEEDMGSTTGPSIEEFHQPWYDFHGRTPKGTPTGPWNSLPNVDRKNFKIWRLDYFGHSNEAAFFLKYGWENAKGDPVEPHAEAMLSSGDMDAALSATPAKVFTPTAEAQLWGCSLALNMAGVLKKYISKITASDTLTTFDEVILDTSRMPQPVSGGLWKTL
jgi:hypothetical protein